MRVVLQGQDTPACLCNVPDMFNCPFLFICTLFVCAIMTFLHVEVDSFVLGTFSAQLSKKAGTDITESSHTEIGEGVRGLAKST